MEVPTPPMSASNEPDALRLREARAAKAISDDLFANGVVATEEEASRISSSCKISCTRRPSDPRRIDLRIELPNGYACRTVSKVAELLNKPERTPFCTPPQPKSSEAADQSSGATSTESLSVLATTPHPVATIKTASANKEQAPFKCTSGRPYCYCKSGRTRALVRYFTSYNLISHSTTISLSLNLS